MTEVRRVVKRLVRPWLGQGPLTPVADLLYAGLRIGEDLRFGLKGRPAASDAIVLAGSGRSGTTWLAEIITAVPGMLQVFEPLHPEWVRAVRRLPGVAADGPFPSADGVYLRPDGVHTEWCGLLERVLEGRVRCYWTDKLRTTYLPHTLVIKMVRANMMLGYLHDQFQPDIVYMIRHPCAVVASRLARGWYAELSHLLAQEVLVADYLEPWVDDIAAERDRVRAHAIWWAVENAVAAHELATRRHCAVQFETLVMQPVQEASRVLEWLGLPKPTSLAETVGRPSSMSRVDTEYDSAMMRLTAWKRELSSEQQRDILMWAERLGFDYYSYDAIPRNPPGGGKSPAERA